MFPLSNAQGQVCQDVSLYNQKWPFFFAFIGVTMDKGSNKHTHTLAPLNSHGAPDRQPAPRSLFITITEAAEEKLDWIKLNVCDDSYKQQICRKHDEGRIYRYVLFITLCKQKSLALQKKTTKKNFYDDPLVNGMDS